MFRFKGRGWRPRTGRCSASPAEGSHHAYLRPAADRLYKIRSGSGFTFSQRTVTRRPRYRVILPECGDCG